MNHTQARPPIRPYVAHVPPPGSLQEWLIRALEVRAVQTRSEVPATPPVEVGQEPVGEREIPAAAVVQPETSPVEVGQESADDPAIPPGRDVPAEPIEVVARPSLEQSAIGAATRVSAIRTRAKIIAMVAMVVAALAAGVGWQLSDQGGAPGAPQAAAGALDATAAGLDGTAPGMNRPVKRAAISETVTLDGWQVRVAGLKNTPQLKSGPGLTTAAFPRALRMSVTLVNVSDHPVAANSWAFSATVDGKPAQLIIYPPGGYVGLPNQLIPPGASMVFPVVVALPPNWADLAIEAVNAHESLAMSFTGTR